MHFLYIITNKLNNKVYIGQSNNNRRWSQHKYSAKNPEKTGQYIHYAMAKYGIENFLFEIIATCRTQEDANETEGFLINYYNSRNKIYGYNSTAGGNYGGHSDETKQKIREAYLKQIKEKGHPALGHKWTDEQKQKFKNTIKSLDKEKIYTPEVRQRMSDAHKGYVIPESQKQNMKAAIKAAYEIRLKEKIESGELKCNAPGCDKIGNIKYRFVNNIRYCQLHAFRLKNNGNFDIKPMNERNLTYGKIPHNKIKFTEEQILNIMTDKRPYRLIAIDFGVTEKVITRVKKENKNNKLLTNI